MRARKRFESAGPWLVSATLLLLCGCASVRPCLVIPAQIELAEAKRDQARKAYEEKLEDVTRSMNNLEVSRGRLDRLIEERDELQRILGEGGAQ